MSRIVLAVVALGAGLACAGPALAGPPHPAALAGSPSAGSPSPAGPQSPAAIIYEIPLDRIELLDPSIEAAGMGGASVAAFWQENPDDHLNPALMGFHRGGRYSYGHTPLYDNITDGIDFTSHRVLVGAWGVGVAMSGKPESIGRLRLSYGESIATDSLGNEIGVVETRQDVRSVAVGVSVFDLASRLLELMGGTPLTIQPRVSLAVGHAWKEVDRDLGAALSGEGENRDWGALLRVAPMDQIGRDIREPRTHRQSRLELAGAYSRLNYDEEGTIEYPVGTSEPILDQRQIGASARLTLALPHDGTRWHRDWAVPAISIGVAFDDADIYLGGQKAGDYATRVGAEVSLFDVFFARVGHVEDNWRNVEGTTFGLGFSLKYRNAIGLRGDWATYPAQDYFDSWNRYGVTLFVDPYRLTHQED